MADRGRVALIPPRYGDDVVGGAEVVIRQAAHGLAARGWDVEVLTTCARSHYTWKNEYTPGTFTDGEVTVRRFPVLLGRSGARRQFLDRQVQLGLPLTADLQWEWLNSHFRVPELYHHLLAHADGFRALVFSPYLFWTTVVGATVAPERTVVIPCLHDEPMAYLDLVRPVLGQVAQVWFMSDPEHDLAHRVGPVAARHPVTAEGVVVPESYDPQGFRDRHGLHRPFVLFAGRREEHKGWLELLAAFEHAVTGLGVDLDLVSFGAGWVGPRPAIASRVVDLGFLSQDEVGHAYAAAAAYIQPSKMESFSRTVMEAWLAGTPVVANAGSEVVRWHCDRSGAGVCYRDTAELAHYLALVADRPELLAAVGSRGRRYVVSNYTWDLALDRMEAALEAMP